MNILLVDKTQGPKLSDSRNGAGKTSFVRIPHYLLGGRFDDSLKSAELVHFSFWGNPEMENAVDDLMRGVAGVKQIERAVKLQTKVHVDGVSTSTDAWKLDVGQLFRPPADVNRLMVGQLVDQLVRDYFGGLLKTFAAESAWESGARIGYLLGFTPEILAKTGKASVLEKNREALKKAIAEGAFGNVSMNELELRAHLVKLHQHRLCLELKLSGFRIDEQYAERWAEADRLIQTIRDLNDEGLVLEQRKRDLELVMQGERPTALSVDTIKQPETMYVKIGIVPPDVAARRFEEVADFHSPVMRNRRLCLESEHVSALDRLKVIEAECRALDHRRADVMNLLNDSMAPETFRSTERELTEVDSTVADLERRLELMQLANDAGPRLRSIMAEVEASVRTGMTEQEELIKEAISLFQQLGEEIYDDRDVSSLIDVNKGVLKITPRIDGDASSGICGVETFLLDVACLAAATKAGWTPRILVYDSLLFDSMDDRQVASCLNIGARPTDDMGLQYIVTLNSDRLQTAKAEGSDRRGRAIDPVLADAGEDGGLFGSRFK